MSADFSLSREEILSGLPAKRARTVLFLIENRTAQFVAQARRAMERFLPDETVEERDLAFLEAFALGKDPPLRPSIQDIERYATKWATLIPNNPGIRATLARLLAEKYTFTSQSVPALRAALGLEEPAVRQAYQRFYRQPLETIYIAGPNLVERLKWSWARLAGWLEELPPFWTAFSLTLTETVGVGILALPIALARIGPVPALVLLLFFGIVNIFTVAFMAESATRSGNVRFGNAYFGRLVADFLGKEGSFLLSIALIILSMLVLLAYYVGLATTMENSTRTPALVWVFMLFLLNLFFLRRGSLNATISAALVVGAVNVTVILILIGITLPHIQVSNLTYANVPYLNGQPFDASILQLAFGVILAAYFGHTSIGNCAKIVLRRDPSGRSLFWGSLLATCASVGLYSGWILAVNGAVAPEELARQTGTALIPLSSVAGPAIQIMGGIFIILGMGMGSIHFSLGSFNQVKEWLPKKRNPVLVIPKRRGQLILRPPKDKNGNFNLVLNYLGFEGDQAYFRLEIKQKNSLRSQEISFQRYWNAEKNLAGLLPHPGPGIDLSLEVLTAGPESVRLRVNTTMGISYEGEWDDSGIDLIEMTSLPKVQRNIIRWITRQGEVDIPELAALTGQDLRVITTEIRALLARDFIREIKTGEDPRYRVQFTPKRRRKITEEVWKALDPDAGNVRTPLFQQLFRGRIIERIGKFPSSERGRSLIGFTPVTLIFLISSWLLLTNSESFSKPLGFIGVIVVSLLAGSFPVLLLISTRRKGDFLPGFYYHFLGNPVLLVLIFILTLGSIFLHGLVIWEDMIQRIVALIAGTLMIIATLSMIRRGAFHPRMVIELRQEQVPEKRITYTVLSGGKISPAEVVLSFDDGESHFYAGAGNTVFTSQLRKAKFLLHPTNARELKIWAHNITDEGDSQHLPAELEIHQGESLHNFDLKNTNGQVLLALANKPEELQLEFTCQTW